MDKEKLKDFFTRYPHNDEVYENNGVLFLNRGAADSYGKAADTVRHTRESAMKEDLPADEAGDDTDKGEDTNTESQTVTKAE